MIPAPTASPTREMTVNSPPMALRRLGFIGILVISLCCTGRAVPPALGWDRGLKPELMARLAREQSVRDSLLASVQTPAGVSVAIIRSMNSIDSGNQAWLKPLLVAHGWPSPAAIDSDGVTAVFLMVQHADRDTAFQAAMLPLVQAAYRAGDLDGQSVALLTDRVAKARGRPQIYGTQTTFQGREPVFDPIEDSAGVDGRRAGLGLPPLAVYKQKLDSMVAAAGKP